MATLFSGTATTNGAVMRIVTTVAAKANEKLSYNVYVMHISEILARYMLDGLIGIEG
jgi:hypothetical protein